MILDAWDTTLRVSALVAMLTATGVSTVAWYRARKAGHSSRALWWVAFIAWTGAALRGLFAFNAPGSLIEVPFWLQVVLANLYFVVLGVGLLIATTNIEDRIYLIKTIEDDLVPRLKEENDNLPVEL